jgi:endonuclease/exonuclease/phosphatase (EEP) superfamily protein YafD
VRRGRPRAGIADLVSWLLVAFVGLVVLTQAFGRTGPTSVAVVQSLTPYLGVALVPVILVALWRGRLELVTVATAVTFGVAVLGTPLAVPDRQRPPAPGSTGLRVAAVNLWFENARIDDVDDALAELDADVIVFSEYTPEHQAALQASALAGSYDVRTDRPGTFADGIAVWSRLPLRVHDEPDTYYGSLDVTVAGPDGDVRIVAMHVPTPLVDADAWRRDLRTAAEVGRSATGPTLLIGDLNASYWHPGFRRVLDAGYVDASDAAGSGFSTSWPTNWPIPPFVRLDHALTAGGLVSTGFDDVDVPGSDHLGLVVTVAPAR